MCVLVCVIAPACHQPLFAGWRFALKGAFKLPCPPRADLEDIVASAGAELVTDTAAGVLRSEAARVVVISDADASTGCKTR